MRRILLVKMSSLGDIVHTMHAVTEAKRARPELEIDWAVEEAFADIPALHPGVRRIHAVAARRWRKRPLRPSTWSELLALRSALRAERYDAVLDAQGLVKSLAVARLAGRPVHGMDRASAREPFASFGYARTYGVARGLHAVERTRLLFAAALGYRAAPPTPEAGLLPPPAPAALGEADHAVLLHGTTWRSKRWPAAFWTDLARRLMEQGYRPVLPWADEDERRVAEAVAGAVAGTLVFPKGPLGEVAGLIAASRLVVGVDTGLLHLAAAFGIRTVSLFGSTAPDLTGPYGALATVLAAPIACAPCGKRECRLVAPGMEPPCHATLTPGDVLADLAAQAAGVEQRGDTWRAMTPRASAGGRTGTWRA